MASVWNTSRPRIKGFSSWTAVSTVREKWPSVPSPMPSRPSSVSNRRKSQFFQGLPTRYVLTSFIFISSADCDFHESQRRDERYTLFQLPESSRIGTRNTFRLSLRFQNSSIRMRSRQEPKPPRPQARGIRTWHHCQRDVKTHA